MTRLAALLLALALVVAACGGDPDAGVTDPTEAAESTVAPTTPTTSDLPATSESATDSTAAAGPPVSGVDGPPAPPDAVPYAGGNDIELSQEVLPVYLVFWAEW